MARKKVATDPKPIGPLIARNLARLGYTETIIKSSEVARLVTEKTGKPMSRQRIAAIVNAVRVEQATIDAIAKGLGVKPSELTRDD